MKRLLLSLLLLAICVAQADSPGSIYHLNVTLTDANGAQHGLDVHRGHPVLVTMFYGSCPVACPLLIDTMRSIERTTSPADRERLRMLLISIDPEHDTVANLSALAMSRKLDGSRWTLARTDATSVRKIAAVLGIQYRQLPDGNYNHSSIVTLLTPNGEIAMQTSELGKADPELLAALAKITAPTSKAPAAR
jgi:protein SCO1/2